jgi:hypothetical protein
MRKPTVMLILDKARALDLLIAVADRTPVPDHFLLTWRPDAIAPASTPIPVLHDDLGRRRLAAPLHLTPRVPALAT